MDGMAVYNTNAESAIDRCLDGIVDDESQIIVDVFICGTEVAPTESETEKSWGNYFQGRSLRKFAQSGNQLAYTMRSHPKVQFRYIVDQQNGYSGPDEITFDGSFTWPL